MTEYKLRATSDEYGERGHCWIEKDGVSIDIEDLLTDVEEMQKENKRLRSLVYEIETRCDPPSELRDIVALRENNAALNDIVQQLRNKPV